MDKKKILIISPRAFGYVEYLYNELKKHKDVEVNIVYLEFLGYKNIFQRILNLLSKKIRKINLKSTFYFQKEEFKSYGFQDEIFIIRPDFLSDSLLSLLKKRTKKFTAYYWDSAQRIERKQKIIHFFDKIYSFDTQDVKKFGLEFITNYIFDERTGNKNPEYLFFNISSNDDDYRFKQLENCADYLDVNNWSYKFISVSFKAFESKNKKIEIINDIIYVKEVVNMIEKCKILIEFQRNNQIGLSFRVFEALGLKKKLITNNTNIVNYDFYNPQNILVIDENNISIPEDFINSDYVEVPDAILKKYRLENWVKNVFDLT